jgi:hypothetical protein
MVAVGDTFTSILEARNAVTRWVLNEGESYHVADSDPNRYVLDCKKAVETTCTFYIRVYNKKTSLIITKMRPHSCHPTVHYQNRAAHSVSFLKEHHRASVIDDRHITARTIRSNERINWGNNISYRQAHRVKERLLEEIDGKEADSYSLFQDYCARVKEEDPHADYAISHDNGIFQACAMCSGATRQAAKYIRKFLGFDATHTHSSYPMMLYMMVGIDANGQIIPLMWAIVPTENRRWWTWFCQYAKEWFP